MVRKNFVCTFAIKKYNKSDFQSFFSHSRIVFSSLYKFCEVAMRCETRCYYFFIPLCLFTANRTAHRRAHPVGRTPFRRSPSAAARHAVARCAAGAPPSFGWEAFLGHASRRPASGTSENRPGEVIFAMRRTYLREDTFVASRRYVRLTAKIRSGEGIRKSPCRTQTFRQGDWGC